MATAIALTNTQVGGVKYVKIVTPSTTTHTDTIDVSSLFTNGCIAFVSCAGSTVAINVALYGAKSITIPGSAGIAVRTIIAIGD
jgi:hypothetical protein